MSRPSFLRRGLFGALAASFICSWVVLGLVVTSGPAQAAPAYQTPYVAPNPVTDDPSPFDVLGYTALDSYCLVLMGCRMRLGPRDSGSDIFVRPAPGGNTSSGSWGPTPGTQAGAGSLPGTGTVVTLDSFTIAADGRGWSTTARWTGNRPIAFWTWQVCGNSAGALATSLIVNQWGNTGAVGNRAWTGTCPSGTVLVSVSTTPDVGQIAKSPVNFPFWNNPDSNWLAKLKGETKYKVLLTCVTPAGDPNSIDDDPVELFEVEYDGTQGGFIYPSCSARSPGSKYVSSTYNYYLPGSTTPTKFMEHNPDRSAYPPECFYDGCPLQVRYKGSPCQAGSVPCSEWTRSRLYDPESYACYWGPKVKPIVVCNGLERAYQLVAVRGTPDNTDGDPATGDNGSGTGGGNTGGGGGGVPSEVPIPGTSPNDPDGGGDSGSCFPSGLAVLNPVEWVLRPIKCALQWAFVPPDGWFEGQFDSVGTGFKAGPLGQWFDLLTGFADTFGSGSSTLRAAHTLAPSVITDPGSGGGGSAGGGVDYGGCSGPTIDLSRIEGMPSNWQPFNACDMPIAGVAATSNLICFVGIVWFGTWRLIRIIGAPFGYNVDAITPAAAR